MEEHQDLGVEECRAYAVVVAFKQAQLLVLPTVFGKQPFRVPLGYKGVIPGMTCSKV